MLLRRKRWLLVCCFRPWFLQKAKGLLVKMAGWGSTGPALLLESSGSNCPPDQGGWQADSRPTTGSPICAWPQSRVCLVEILTFRLRFPITQTQPPSSPTWTIPTCLWGGDVTGLLHWPDLHHLPLQQPNLEFLMSASSHVDEERRRQAGYKVATLRRSSNLDNHHKGLQQRGKN